MGLEKLIGTKDHETRGNRTSGFFLAVACLARAEGDIATADEATSLSNEASYTHQDQQRQRRLARQAEGGSADLDSP